MGATRPFFLVHFSDLHIGATWAGGDPAANLTAAVSEARRVCPAIDALLVSGDIADHGADAEYEQAAALLAPLEAPIYVTTGNHDDRAALRRHFAVPGEGTGELHYVVELGPLRLIVLDSQRPGSDGGQLNAGCLAWLTEELPRGGPTPVLIAVHHPPVELGIRVFDEIGIPEADARALAEVIRPHPQVRWILAGHVHRVAAGDLAGRTVLTVPSTYAESVLAWDSDQLEMDSGISGFAIHAILDGDVRTHIATLRRPSAP